MHVIVSLPLTSIPAPLPLPSSFSLFVSPTRLPPPRASMTLPQLVIVSLSHSPQSLRLSSCSLSLSLPRAFLYPPSTRVDDSTPARYCLSPTHLNPSASPPSQLVFSLFVSPTRLSLSPLHARR